MEKRIEIKTDDGKTIYAVLNGPLTQPVVFLVHGLSSHANHITCHNAVPFFNKKGFSVFRINLYSSQKNARILHETTLRTHGLDIDSCLGYLKKKGVKKIFMAGHSYGFPSILCASDRSMRAIVSWDGSFLPHNFFDNLPKSKDVRGRMMAGGTLVLLGENMVREAKELSIEKIFKTFTVPIKFISASVKAENNRAEMRRMSKLLAAPNEMAVIKGASHNFVEEGVLEKLYEETYSWFKKYL